MLVLDLGCGQNKLKDSIGIDINTDSAADVIWDLNNPAYPFLDNYFDKIVSKQVFEHLVDVELVMKEIHRITKNKGSVQIYVPHFSCFYSYGDPSHKRCFSVFAFDKIANRCGFKIVSKKITFHRAFRRYGIAFLANKFPVAYERFWTFIFPAEHIYFEFEVLKNTETLK